MASTQRLRLSRRGHRRGVTLTEAVVASALLLIGIVPLLKALATTHAMDRAIERKSWSLMLAQRELERIRAHCLYHYDENFSPSSFLVQDGYLCTVTDDRDPALRTVTVLVGLDLNADGLLSEDEVEVCLSTRVARRSCDWHDGIHDGLRQGECSVEGRQL